MWDLIDAPQMHILLFLLYALDVLLLFFLKDLLSLLLFPSLCGILIPCYYFQIPQELSSLILDVFENYESNEEQSKRVIQVIAQSRDLVMAANELAN